MANKNVSRDFSCDICDKVFASAPVLKIHNQIVHKVQEKKLSVDTGEILDSSTVQYETKSLKSRINHLDCTINDNIEVNQFEDNSVMKSKSDVETELTLGCKYRCEECDIDFRQERSLNNHKKFVHNGIKKSMQTKTYNCDICEKSYKKLSVLNKHVKARHANIRYNCGQCDKKYVAKDMLKLHLDMYHGNRNPAFKCRVENCGKAYYQKSTLYEH